MDHDIEYLMQKVNESRLSGDRLSLFNLLEKIIELRPSDILSVWKFKSTELYLDERYEEALDVLYEAIESYPNDDDCYYRLGVILLDFGFIKQSFWAYTRALELNPSNGFAYYNRGHIRKAAFDVSGAREDFKAANVLGIPDSENWINYASNIGNKNPLEQTIDKINLNRNELEEEVMGLVKSEDLIGALGAINQAISLYPKFPHLKEMKEMINKKLGIS